jgi:hypothetical protein
MLPPLLCCRRRCARRDTAPGARRRSLMQPVPLVELTRLKARCLGPCVALPACACVAGYAQCTGAPRCTAWTPGFPPVQLTILMPAYEQHPARVPTTRLPLPLRRVSARSLYRRAEPSPPFLSPDAARVASTQCTAIKGGPLVASRPRQRPCPPPETVTVALAFVFHHTAGAKPPHPSSLPVCRSRSFAGAQSCTPTRRTDTFTAVELWRR